MRRKSEFSRENCEEFVDTICEKRLLKSDYMIDFKLLYSNCALCTVKTLNNRQKQAIIRKHVQNIFPTTSK